MSKGLFKSNWHWMALLFSAVVLSYLPVLSNDFVNWDDQDVIVNNPQIRNINPDSIRWMFTTFATGNWMPLTWLSFAVNYQLAGLNPAAFHATNVLLHGLNTVLVFLVCLRLMRAIPSDPEAKPGLLRAREFALPISLLTALLFGLHPVHVESVAWATERKDVLYSFFYLWALYVYLDYADDHKKISPSFRGRNETPSAGFQNSRYPKLLLSLFLYLLALLSKPMAVTLPFIFLILDYWPLGRFGREYRVLLKEKISFFAPAALSVGVTMASHLHTLSYAQSGVELYWALNAFRSPLFYLYKMAWPFGLCAYYPFPPEITAAYILENVGAVLAVALLTWFFFRRRRDAPYLLAAWAYFLVTLLPILGFVQTGSQAAADRYTYLPSLAFFLLLSAGLARWASYSRVIFGVAAAMAAGILGYLTVGQIGTWKNTQVLWERVTSLYPDENPDSYSRLGAAYFKSHKYDEALSAFARAAAIPPPLARTFHGLGTALVYKDRIPEAIEAFNYALQLDPTFNGPRANLWNVYERLGQHEKAIQIMQEALKVEPSSALFYNNIGVSETFLKHDPQAKAAFESAHRLDPKNSEYLVNLATICQWEGRPGEALDWYRKGIALDPKEPVYFLKMGDLYLAGGRKAKALEVLQKAWDLHPTTPKVAQQIGEDFQKLGKSGLAQNCFQEAQRLTLPSNAPSPGAMGNN